MTDTEDIAVALRYVDYFRTGDEAILDEAFTSDFYDHVSGQTGPQMMRVVREWIEQSVADAEYWAVRDDLGVLRQLESPEPLDVRRDRPRM
jgi:hypothetical protein